MELIDQKSTTTNAALNQVIEFVGDHDFSEEAAGTHTVSDDFFYNIIEMDTVEDASERIWESHKVYYDIHMILAGEERIGFNFLSHMDLGEYKADDDYQAMEGDKQFDLVLKPGQLLLLDENDAHKTGLAVDGAQSLRKIVFKVKM